MECPILVWMLTWSRPITEQEFHDCISTLKKCAPHVNIPPVYTSDECRRQAILHILPLLMMRHRRVPRSKWKDKQNTNGKHWIEQDVDTAMNPTHRLRAMIGYHLAADNRLFGMVMTQGRQREVVNLGIGIKQLSTGGGDMSVQVYAESQYHKLTQLEISFIPPSEPPEVILRRLCLMLALKQAYIKAIGQPLGFDWSRLEFNLPGETARGDGYPLQGWEFRVWTTHQAIQLDNGEVEEQMYQCASAFFRGSQESTFIWHKDRKDLEGWVQFLTIEQLIAVLPKLLD